MKTSIKNELKTHIIETINDQQLDNFDELHYHAFNEDYYIIGYYQADQWLKQHDVSSFDAINTVKEYEVSNFGEMTTDINSESIVNMYVYILGEELLSEFDLDQDANELIEEIENS